MSYQNQCVIGERHKINGEILPYLMVAVNSFVMMFSIDEIIKGQQRSRNKTTVMKTTLDTSLDICDKLLCLCL